MSRFKITAKLGEGGVGEVYRAAVIKLGREVAINLLKQPWLVGVHLVRYESREPRCEVLAFRDGF